MGLGCGATRLEARREELDGGGPGLGREAGPDLGGRDDEIGR